MASLDALLSKATSNDESPPPGYVFVELIKLLNADVMACEKCADALYKRLARNEAAVKWKVLLVMKQVSRGGRIEFRRALQRANADVKSCLQFKGPPDPLRGDEPYRRVRDAAKDALEAMFAADSGPSQAQSSQLGGRITGYSSGSGPGGSGGSGGPDPRFPPPASVSGGGDPRFPPPAPRAGAPGGVNGGGGGSGGGGVMPGQAGYDPNSQLHQPPITTGSMSGFGNYDPKKDVGVASGILGALTSAFSTSVTTVPPPTRQAGATQQRGGLPPPDPRQGGVPYGAPGASGGYGPGQAGGGWGASGQGQGLPGEAALGRRGHMPPGSAGGSLGRVGGAAKDGGYERSLVEDVTAAGGVRPVPDKDKLAKFLADARTLDMAVVSPLLDERLGMGYPGGGSENVSAKALAVVEAIGSDKSLETPRKYLADHCDVLLDLMENADVKASLREGAFRALRALGVGVERPSTLAAPAAASAGTFSYSSPPAAEAAAAGPASAPGLAARQPELDLLGLDFGTSAPVPASAPAPTPAFAAPAPFAPAPFASAPFAPAPLGSQPAGSSLGDMFGGMSLAGPGAAASSPASFPQFAASPFATQAQLQPQPQAPPPMLQMPMQPPMMQVLQPMQQQPTFVPQAGGVQQQLMALQAQISSLTQQLSLSPTQAGLIMPMLMQLQQQQSVLLMQLAGGGGQMGGMSIPMSMQAGPTMLPVPQQQPQQQPPKPAAAARAPDAFAGLGGDLFK